MRSASRCAAAAYWASWADALPMIAERNPGVADMVVRTMEVEQEIPEGGCMAEFEAAWSQLDREGFRWRPSWSELRHGKRPPEPTGEPGEWKHGWQYWASSVSDAYFRKTNHAAGPLCRLSRSPSLALRPQRRRRVGLTRPCVPVAGNLWTRWGATEPHAPAPEGCGNEPRLSSACWLACAAKRAQG